MVQWVRCIGFRLPDGRRSDVLWPFRDNNFGDAAVLEHLIGKGILPVCGVRWNAKRGFIFGGVTLSGMTAVIR
jgi:hypothetical protein